MGFVDLACLNKPDRLTIVPDCQIRYIIRKICTLWELCELRQWNCKKNQSDEKNAKCCAVKAASQLFYTSYCHLSWTHCKKLLSQKFSTLPFFFASDGWYGWWQKSQGRKNCITWCNRSSQPFNIPLVLSLQLIVRVIKSVHSQVFWSWWMTYCWWQKITG